MSVALEDIWDAPATDSASVPRTPSAYDGDASPRATKRRRSSQLFLESDSDDDAPPARRTTAPSLPRTPSAAPPDIDHLFADLDDDAGLAPLAPSLDTVALQRVAEARHGVSHPLTPHAILPSSSPPRDGDDAAARWRAGGDKDKEGGAGEKKRKQVVKMDEARLLGPDGFPALIKQTKGFHPKGKGHEQSDLNRLLQIYQFWTHKMYPKGQFRDTVSTVEKLCHSKRMHVALSVWRDESKGLINGRPPPEDEPLDIPSDDENEDIIPRATDAHLGRSSSPARSSPTPAARITRPPPAYPPTSGSEMDDDFDIDEMIRENEERSTASSSARRAPAALASQRENATTVNDPMDDVDFWEELARDAGNPNIDLNLDEPPASGAQPPPLAARPPAGTSIIDVDDDFDMDEDAWNALNELETQGPSNTQLSANAAPSPAPKQGTTGQPASDNVMTEEDWEKDMYA